MNKILGLGCLLLFFVCACSKLERSMKVQFTPLDSDTVLVNQRYDKYLNYTNETFDKRMGGSDRNVNGNLRREIVLYYLADTKVRDESYIKNSDLKDSIIATKHNEIDLRSIHFIKAGAYYLSGYIVDRLIDNEGRVIEKIESSIEKKITVIEESRSKVDFYGQLVFPDTIVVDEYYKSHIDYAHPKFDEYHLNKDIRVLRSLTFYFTIDTVRYDAGVIENKIKDSIFSSNKNKIELYKIAISKPGVHYISGYIDDEILIDSLNNNNNKDGKLPGHLFRSHLTKKVVVISK